MRISFTDGICRKCAARVRADLGVPRAGGMPAGQRAWMPGIAPVILGVIALVLLIARPTHDGPLPWGAALRPPGDEPEPAASPWLAASSAAAGHPRAAVAARPGPARLREAHHLGPFQPHVAVVPRLHAPRDSAQSP
jgi:hypothetical protein